MLLFLKFGGLQKDGDCEAECSSRFHKAKSHQVQNLSLHFWVSCQGIILILTEFYKKFLYSQQVRTRPKISLPDMEFYSLVRFLCIYFSMQLQVNHFILFIVKWNELNDEVPQFFGSTKNVYWLLNVYWTLWKFAKYEREKECTRV